MAFTKTQVCNMALAHLATSAISGDVDTSDRDEANTLNLFWQPAQEYMLELYRPDLANKYATLTLVESNPNDDWDYSYQYPSDCVFFKGFVTGVPDGMSPINDQIMWETSSDNTQRLIFTNYGPTADCRYIKRFDQPSDWPATWATALSYYLAWMAASDITDSRTLRAQALKDGEGAAMDALSVSRQERSQNLPMDSAGIRARSS